MAKVVVNYGQVEHSDWTTALKNEDWQNENYRFRIDGALETFPKPTRVRWKAAGRIFWGPVDNSLSHYQSLPVWQISVSICLLSMFQAWYRPCLKQTSARWTFARAPGSEAWSKSRGNTGGPKNFLDIFGEIRKKNGNFQIFTHPPPPPPPSHK